jgi:hypothetical protein
MSGRALRISEQDEARRARTEIHRQDRVADLARVAGRAGQAIAAIDRCS